MSDLPYQIRFTNTKAQRVFGALMRQWSKDPSTLPGRSDRGDDFPAEMPFSVDAKKFKTVLRAAGLTPEVDFILDGRVKEIEILCRKPDTLTLLLPDPKVLEKLEDKPPHPIHVSASILDAKDREDVSVEDQKEVVPVGERPAMKRVILEDADAYAAFLDEYMADYAPGQCL